jgi:tetratricopeptide (TPR) repeat protein
MRTLKALVLTLPSLILTGEAVSVMTVGALLAAPVAHAAKDSVSAKVGKPLQEAQNLVKANDLKGAMAKIKEAQAISGKTPFEEKTINEFLAFVALKQGDYNAAAKAYEDLLSSNPDPQQLPQRLKTLTQLNYQNKNYPKAVQFGSRYMKEVGNDVDIALLVAQAYYIQKDYANTLTATQGLIKAAQAANQPVKENWLQLQMSSLHNLGRDEEASVVLEKMLASYPSKQYWKDMLQIVQSRTSLGDRGKVELYRLKRAAEVLEPDEIVDMAEICMAIGVPGDAKSVLEAGFASGALGKGTSKERENRLLNLARTQSAEDQKAIEGQAKQAASAATGDLDTKIGEAFTSYGQPDKAVESIKRGLQKGGVTAPDEANLHLGQALFANKQYGDAVTAFKAVKSDSKYAQLARLWVILASNKK